MKIQNLLEDDTATSEEIRLVQPLIEAVYQARPFFQQRGSSKFLFRGIVGRNNPNDMYDEFVRVVAPRQNRRPKDSSTMLHNALDERLNNAFGVPYRSAGLFVTGDRMQAREYGEPAIILPQGDFKFSWGTKVRDSLHYFSMNGFKQYIEKNATDTLVTEFGDMFRYGINEDDWNRLMRYNEEAAALWNDWMDMMFYEGHYTNENLSAAIDSNNEIMLSCNRYAIVRLSENIRSWYIQAANQILDTTLPAEGGIDMITFVNILSEHV